ncbi:hypothetical protein R1flu_020668 [Riccia fluitans]|uniref:Uncharacterized protein n=1 Tax=Riccia fluitans TaxID=41844 RepID=A0ABD1ZMI3_9MARC
MIRQRLTASYVEVQVQAEEILVVGHSTRAEASRKEKVKAPMVDEDEIPVIVPILNEEVPNAKEETVQRGNKQRQDSPKIPADKPKSRKKTKVTKKPHKMIDLSNESQEVKQEKQTILPEDILQLLESDIIEKFCLSLVYGEQKIIPILHILEGNRTQVEADVGRQITFMEIALHLSKENRQEERQKL